MKHYKFFSTIRKESSIINRGFDFNNETGLCDFNCYIDSVIESIDNTTKSIAFDCYRIIEKYHSAQPICQMLFIITDELVKWYEVGLTLEKVARNIFLRVK